MRSFPNYPHNSNLRSGSTTPTPRMSQNGFQPPLIRQRPINSYNVTITTDLFATILDENVLSPAQFGHTISTITPVLNDLNTKFNMDVTLPGGNGNTGTVIDEKSFRTLSKASDQTRENYARNAQALISVLQNVQWSDSGIEEFKASLKKDFIGTLNTYFGFAKELGLVQDSH